MNLKRYLCHLVWATVLLAVVSSCGDDDQNDFILKPNPGITPTPDQQSFAPYVCRLEVPLLKQDNLFIQHSVEYRGDSVMNYCFEYDPLKRHSRWVAFRFDPITRLKNVGRSSEPFIDDPDVPTRYHIGYNGFGNQYRDLDGKLQTLPSRQFDRGHLCASADRYLSREANEQTFYMTNMSPQMSNFNSPYWSSFEGYVQSRGRDASFADTLYVVKGGTIADDQILGYVSRSNGSSVAIPQYYFMALLKCKNNTYSALAFWMEHRDYGNIELNNAQMAARIITIDELEEKTGIDFFHNLPDNVETVVESIVTKSAWGF